jgi:crotonobetainyl-CoA:carnitine CoA-transferase CaiB-like acyl-CoA transferase
MAISNDASDPAPLTGVRILDFSAALSGPYATRTLGELGAEVIKVEPLDGDQARAWEPTWEGDGCYFFDVNNNKRSICIDLKHPLAREPIERLVPRVDVVVENFRPGVMKRLGLDYPMLKELHEGLIYCSISAYGQEGPRATEGGYDATIQALSGITRSNGAADGPPRRVGLSIVDRGTSLWSVIAILSALHQRSVTGRGRYIDVSLLDAAISWMSYDILRFLATGSAPARRDVGGKGAAPNQGFEAQDGFIHVTAPNQAMWLRMCDAIGHPELQDDPRFATLSDRLSHTSALAEQLTKIFRGAPRSQWVARLSAKGVPCTSVNTVEEALADPQVLMRGNITPVLGDGTTRSYVRSPLGFGGLELEQYSAAPALGADADAILSDDLGFSAEEISALRAAGAVR